ADALPHLAGEHNRRNGAAALAALELAGESRAEAERALREFRGVGRRFELVGEERGVAVYDDYAHHPTELAATIAAARERGERVHVLFQPHLPSRTRHLAHDVGVALAEADCACVTELCAAREEIPPGLSGKALVDAATAGLGSNLLVAADGVEALVLRLGGALARAEVEGDLLVAGGGAANAVCLHRARAAGLGGFEFACAIPGTVGGGVWMNAGAYGG